MPLSNLDSLRAFDEFKVLGGDLQPFNSGQCFDPFGDEVVLFLSTLSENLLSSSSRSLWPDLAAFGNWIRPSNINRLRMQFQNHESAYSGVLAPRGASLQFAPSNVEALFAYSWAVATLCGCSSVIRVSTRKGEMTNFLLDAIQSALLVSHFQPRWAFVEYPRKLENITALLSKKSQATVIWGGNESVKNLRELEHGPDVRIIPFPDRDSLSVIDAQSYMELDNLGRQKIVKLFARDASSFGQQACSSPRRLVWIGTKVEQPARDDFMIRLQNLTTELNAISASEAMRVMAYTHALAAASSSTDFKLTRVGDFQFINGSPLSDSGATHPGLGVLRETWIEDLDTLATQLIAGDQTLTYFGVPTENWKAWIPRNLDLSPLRIVPIGTAVDFDVIWDGMDLLMEFTKIIAVH